MGQLRHGKRGSVRHQEIDVICLTVHFNKSAPPRKAQHSEEDSQAMEMDPGKEFAPILRDKDQVHLKLEDGVA